MNGLSNDEQKIVDHVGRLLDDIGRTVDELEAEADRVWHLTRTESSASQKEQADRKAVDKARRLANKASAEEEEIANKVNNMLRIIKQNSSFGAYKATKAAGGLPFLERLNRFFSDDIFIELTDLHTAAVTNITAIKFYQCQLATAIKWFPYRGSPFRAETGRYRNT